MDTGFEDGYVKVFISEVIIGLEKNEDILKRHISLDLLYQTIETLDFPKWEFPQ